MYGYFSYIVGSSSSYYTLYMKQNVNPFTLITKKDRVRIMKTLFPVQLQIVAM